MTGLSYAHGASDLPLLGETIGERLRSTVERFGDQIPTRSPFSTPRASSPRAARPDSAHSSRYVAR